MTPPRQLVYAGLILVLGLASLGNLTATLIAQAQPDLNGVYRCEGTNPDGSPYAGSVQITQEGEAWLLSWEFEHSGEGVGIGLWNAPVLSVIFRTSDGTIGLSSYVLTDGRLVGKWTVPGAGKVFTETLTKMPERVAAP